MTSIQKPDGAHLPRRVGLWFRTLLCCLPCVSLEACKNPDCPAPEFDEGERFRITVLSRESQPGQDCAPLNQGDTFELVAGDWSEGTERCDFRGARADTSPFDGTTFVGCSSSQLNLGLGCWATHTPGVCGAEFSMYVITEIRRSDTVIENGQLAMNWQNQDCTRSCEERFTVRIEILDRLPAAASATVSPAATAN